MKLKIGKLLLIALLIRLVLVPLSFHSDLNNNAIWGIYAQEFGLKGFYDWLNFGNYARPDYPPLAMVLFLILRWVWQIIFSFLWKLNLLIPVFPSKLIPWFETYGYLSLIKFPGVLADIGIGYVIYKWIKGEGNEKKALSYSTLFLFNPAIIYLSASWGQLDSVVGFFGLLAAVMILKKKYFSALASFFISIMIKATMVVSGPIFLLKSLQDKVSARKVLKVSLFSIILIWILGNLFIDKSPVIWLIKTYWVKIIPGAVTLPYINLNAFNFWGMILGLARVKEETVFLGFPLYLWAWSISIFFFIVVLWNFWKGKDFFYALMLIFFVAFMFLPRVHERYLYPIFVFFPLVLIKYPKLTKIFLALSFTFLVNLYHWWWFPRIEPFIIFFDLETVERGLSLTNTIFFGILFKGYLKSKN